MEARSQAHIKSSLPYDFPLGFYREGTILPVSVGAGLLPFRQGYCGRRLAGHGCSPASTDTVQGLASHGPPLAYSQGAPTVYSPRSSPAHSQGVTCAFTGHAACAATLGRPRAPQLPRAQAPGSRPYAATARRPWAPECRQAPVLCLACPAARGPQWVGPTPLGWQWVGLALLWVVQGPTTPLDLRWAAARWWAGQWVRPLG